MEHLRQLSPGQGIVRPHQAVLRREVGQVPFLCAVPADRRALPGADTCAAAPGRQGLCRPDEVLQGLRTAVYPPRRISIKRPGPSPWPRCGTPAGYRLRKKRAAGATSPAYRLAAAVFPGRPCDRRIQYRRWSPRVIIFVGEAGNRQGAVCVSRRKVPAAEAGAAMGKNHARCSAERTIVSWRTDPFGKCVPQKLAFHYNNIIAARILPG
jgi:hypothetical protein